MRQRDVAHLGAERSHIIERRVAHGRECADRDRRGNTLRLADHDARQARRAPHLETAARARRRSSSRVDRGRRSTSRPIAASSTVRPNDADVVERRRERDEAVAAHAAVRRFDTDDAAERRGLSHGATGLRAERDARDTGGDGGRRSARRSARDTIGRERILRRTERAVLGRRPHREFVHVRLGDDDRARGAQAFQPPSPSYGLTYPSRMREPHDVGMTVVAMLSLMTTGTPSSGARLPASSDRAAGGGLAARSAVIGPDAAECSGHRGRRRTPLRRTTHAASLAVIDRRGDRRRAARRRELSVAVMTRPLVVMRRESRHEEEAVTHAGCELVARALQRHRRTTSSRKRRARPDRRRRLDAAGVDLRPTRPCARGWCSARRRAPRALLVERRAAPVRRCARTSSIVTATTRRRARGWPAR